VRASDERALRKERYRAVVLFALIVPFALGGCVNEGIFPKADLPPPNPDGPLPFPTLSAAPVDDGERILTTAEREALEAQLSKLARDREAGVKKRIESKK
jgi:hypothetical protein